MAPDTDVSGGRHDADQRRSAKLGHPASKAIHASRSLDFLAGIVDALTYSAEHLVPAGVRRHVVQRIVWTKRSERLGRLKIERLGHWKLRRSGPSLQTAPQDPGDVAVAKRVRILRRALRICQDEVQATSKALMQLSKALELMLAEGHAS